MKPPVGSRWKYRPDWHGSYEGTVVVRRHVTPTLVECELPEWTGGNGNIRTYPLSYWSNRLVAA